MLQNIINILEFGAISDGKVVNTEIFQRAIDSLSEIGGGKIVVPPGTYLTGKIWIKSNITLEIEAGAIIKGSSNVADYPLPDWEFFENAPNWWRHLIVGNEIENACICGRGTIDGSGPAFWEQPGTVREWIPYKKPRVENMILFRKSKNIAIKDIHLYNSPAWTLHLFETDNVTIDNIRIEGALFGPNIDGIDIQGCNNVRISNCDMYCGDDAIVAFPSKDRDCENVTAVNCTVRTNCVGFKAYTWRGRAVRRLCFSNSIVYNSTRAVGLYQFKEGLIEDITITGCVFDTDSGFHLNRAIQMSTEQSDSNDIDSKKNCIRNVQISNIVIKSDGRILMTAGKNRIIENVILRDIQCIYPVIDDPRVYPLEKIRSNQFPVYAPEAAHARACIVAQGVSSLFVDNVRPVWPSETPNTKWGGLLDQKGESIPYLRSSDIEKEVPFSVLWAKDVSSGYIACPLAKPSIDGISKYELINSNIICKDT